LETKLQPKLEDFLGEPLMKTAERYCEIDWKTVGSRHWVVELKSRPKYRITDGKYQDSKSFDTWMIPTTKRKPEGYDDLLVWYYWEADDSLWYWCWDEESAKTFKVMPNKNGQLTYHVPAELFTKVE
jgi:hypothetical protein